MLDKILSGWKVFEFAHAPDYHTFTVKVGPLNSPLATKACRLDISSFPAHVPLVFMDEKVQIGEDVIVVFKKEKELIKEGWKPFGKSSLKKKGAMFNIGKEKRKLLGSTQKGRMGVDADFNLYFYSAGGWRFSSAEIKCIMKAPKRNQKFDGGSGTFTYDLNTLILPDGHAVQGRNLTDMLLALKAFKLG